MSRSGTLKFISYVMLVTSVAGVMFLLVLLPQTAHAQTRGESDDPQPSERIVGGAAVPNGKYPFVTALLDKGYGNAYDRQLCGGTLIDSDKVLTAAHCVSGVDARNLQTATGRTVLDSGQGQVRNVSDLVVHPRFDAAVGTYEYDAAVITLKRPVSNIQPVALATGAQDNLERAGLSATIAGWGNTEKQPASGFGDIDYPNRMQEAQVPLVADAEASQSYPNYVSALMVAAGKVGKDSCQGDSGGPMFAQTPNGPTQIGITSFGTGCGAPDYPGVYAEVNNPSISGFINRQLADGDETSSIEQTSNETVSITQTSSHTTG